FWTGPNGFTSNLQNPSIAPVSIQNKGDYFLKIKVLNCESISDTTFVDIVDTIIATPSSNAPKCAGEDLQLFAQTVVGATYAWSGPNGFSSNLQNPEVTNTSASSSGIYTLTVSLSSCSSAPTTLIINFDAQTFGGNIFQDTTVCAGQNDGTLFLSGNIGDPIRWEYSDNGGTNWFPIIGSTTSHNYLNLTSNTQHRVLVKNGSCPTAYSSIATVTVTEAAKGGRIIASSPDPSFAICPEDNEGKLFLVDYEGVVDHWEYSRDNGKTWVSDFNTTSVYQYLNIPKTTWYRAVLMGCMITDTSEMYALTVSQDACESMVIANLVTPNGDGKNDTWLIENIESYPPIDVRIFNRSGHEIYHNSSYDNSWDGTFQGRKSQDGTYYYLMQIGGDEKVLKGSINLLH
ncbi:MAG: gliding motility-associated C-terminal domain-containing protein, partial [Bacteroidetes bacterium]|nr:gliding motility-associated C-terminal domain-containing protein [Bacteroidota bacterium]